MMLFIISAQQHLHASCLPTVSLRGLTTDNWWVFIGGSTTDISILGEVHGTTPDGYLFIRVMPAALEVVVVHRLWSLLSSIFPSTVEIIGRITTPLANSGTGSDSASRIFFAFSLHLQHQNSTPHHHKVYWNRRSNRQTVIS